MAHPVSDPPPPLLKVEMDAVKVTPDTDPTALLFRKMTDDGWTYEARYMFDPMHDLRAVLMEVVHVPTRHAQWTYTSPGTWNILVEDPPMLNGMFNMSKDEVRARDGRCDGSTHPGPCVGDERPSESPTGGWSDG
jgi:hypothetical protein